MDGMKECSKNEINERSQTDATDVNVSRSWLAAAL